MLSVNKYLFWCFCADAIVLSWQEPLFWLAFILTSRQPPTREPRCKLKVKGEKPNGAAMKWQKPAISSKAIKAAVKGFHDASFGETTKHSVFLNPPNYNSKASWHKEAFIPCQNTQGTVLNSQGNEVHSCGTTTEKALLLTPTPSFWQGWHTQMALSEDFRGWTLRGGSHSENLGRLPCSACSFPKAEQRCQDLRL